MFHGISHIDLQTVNLEQAQQFWTNVVEFAPTREGEGYVELDSGNVAVRLIEVKTVTQTTTIRLSVYDVTKAYEILIKAGATSLYEPMKTPGLEKIACVKEANGHSVIVWRALSEDEWDFVPELPKTGEWYPDAEDLLVRLLSHVPAFFRMLARRKVTRVVEQLAKDDDSPVTTEHVIKGFITSSAKVTRSRMIQPLKDEGINPDDYKEDFDYE